MYLRHGLRVKFELSDEKTVGNVSSKVDGLGDIYIVHSFAYNSRYGQLQAYLDRFPTQQPKVSTR